VGGRIGFSATGSFNRSDFGITFGLPQPGSHPAVHDPAELVPDAQFVTPRGRDRAGTYASSRIERLLVSCWI
jgi:hypothetical protein